MERKPTIKDIANELNTNISTVSRALSDHPAISASTKEAVRLVAQKLNYSQNKIASSLRLGKTNIVGVLVPSTDLSFFGSVIHGIEQVMNKNGYNVLLYQSNESYKNGTMGIETFLQSRLDGIIASIALETTDLDHYKDIINRNIPMVLFDRTNDELHVPSVIIDDYKGGFIATEHLISQGYESIAHIAAKQQITIFTDRLKGYKDALIKHGLPVNEDLIIEGNLSISSGKSCMEQLLNKSVKPDAVFAVEDFTALGAIQYLQSKGISIPDEFGVVGFANESFSEYITPGLSTVDQQTKKMGEEAANLFLKLLNSKNQEGKMPKKIVLDPILVKRKSSSRLG